MDDIVRQAIAKWPNVPDCYGWLGLDARGNWYMRDDRTQAAGPFSSADGGTPASRGSLLRHEKLVEFIQRNYESDAQGHWFFQNGPQRVYVELDLTPMVWRVAKGPTALPSRPTLALPATPELQRAGRAGSSVPAVQAATTQPLCWAWFTPRTWGWHPTPLNRACGRRTDARPAQICRALWLCAQPAGTPCAAIKKAGQ
jgi:hypothetical protein